MVQALGGICYIPETDMYVTMAFPVMLCNIYSVVSVPDRRIELVNVVFVCKNKSSVCGLVSLWGDGKRKGRKALGFEQGT